MSKYDIVKTMNWLKKFWIVFLSFLPIGAGAVAPFVVIGGVAATAIAGYSIYRSLVPVDMTQALNFFSSCWSCQMFSDIMSTMSNILPKVYTNIGETIIPFAVILSAIWFAWKLTDGFLNSKIENGWSLMHWFSVHIAKLGFVCVLLVAPLPRLISEIAIEPIFNIGLSINRVMAHDDNFDTCVIATAIADPVSIDERAANAGAYSPKLRHNLACEVATIHQMTGLGMTVGWTMLNMAFDSDYMHTIMWGIPIFPNVVVFFAGALILLLFFYALLPIPVYFLEIFIKLSLDLVMLPLMLLAWLFKGWKISLPGAGKTIRNIIDQIISGTLGIAITGVFLSFAIMFLHAAFGNWSGADALSTAIAQNDSKFLMDALMFHNDSLVTVVLMGIFITMFMIMIPTLAKTFFNISISTEFYDKTKKNIDIMWESLKKWYAAIKK